MPSNFERFLVNGKAQYILGVLVAIIGVGIALLLSSYSRLVTVVIFIITICAIFVTGIYSIPTLFNVYLGYVFLSIF